MCLSNIYRASDKKLLMDNTARIEVKDGTVIPISQRKKKEFLSALSEYLGEQI